MFYAPLVGAYCILGGTHPHIIAVIAIISPYACVALAVGQAYRFFYV